MIVRIATPGDVPAIRQLIIALATYERDPDAVRATEQSLHQTLFSQDAKVYAFVAEIEGNVCGIAIWFLNYSTWTGRPGIYLEDLFVAETARGTGAGRALLRALAQEAVARNCARIDWAVLDWNAPAMDFYRALGARPQSGWQPWRLDGDALAEMAK
ncbi:N-acetyltransferase family protein [Sphingomonas sp. ASY06-1R]|jgi:GNAT superfamily N-acetyltransferase|uniref:GNAT family N-acetyltransferase n=1 Tax=Sphingomonas sp. ASY06-1R TaxID=3445771 RepID=UPI003FA1BF88